jgi:Ala-tRNA(Pro) deacylase
MSKKVKLPSKTLKHLEKFGVKHNLLEHKRVYTAMDVAMTMKRRLDEVVKSLLIKADKDYWVVLLPADHNLDLSKLKSILKKASKKEIKVVKIPGEKIAQQVLKIRDEAMSAFGSLYSLPVIMESKLAKVKKAVFASGSFNHSVEIAVKDFIKLEQAVLGSFGIKKKIIFVKAKPAKKRSPKKKLAQKKIIKKKRK